MNTYRTLTYQELDILQEDFTDFLYLEGYSRFDWRVLLEQHSEFALDMLNRYSDQAFEKVMKTVDYVERLKNGRLTTIYCHSQYFDIAAIDLKINQSSLYFKRKLLSDANKANLGISKIRFKKVNYTIKREQEVFDLIERGYQHTTNTNHFFIKELRESQEN